MAPFLGIICLFYILTKKRNVDFYTLAVFSSVFYFLPIFFGYTWFRHGAEDVFTPVTSQMDLVYSAVFLALLIGSILNDVLILQPFPPTKRNSAHKQLVYYAAALFAWLIFVMMHTQDLIAARKENFGAAYSFAFTSVAIAFIVAVLSKSLKWTSVFFVVALIDLYAGNREILAFIALTIFIIGMINQGRIRLFLYIRLFLPLLLIVTLLLTYKMIAAAVVLQRWDLVGERLGDLEFYYVVIMQSEPFVTQSLLSNAITEEWTFTKSVLLNLLIIISPFGSLFAEEVRSLSSVINQHMGYLNYGVASNIWAEAYMLGRLPMVIIFVFIYAALPALFNVMFFKWRTVVARTVIALSAVTLVFFIHRAGMEYAVNIIKRFLTYALILHFAFAFLKVSQTK